VSPDEPIPLARPELGRREEDLVLEVMRSGRLSLGPVLERFEREFAGWLGTADAVAVSSGTAALHLGVRALGWGAGAEVVTSPFSFVASANCLLYEEVTPVFADIDPVTLNVDPQAVRAAVTGRTAGVLPVHLFGYPADLGSLEEIARERGLGVLEDACEAVGGVDADGVRIGARGNLATFAFYANKQLTTGEGGVIIPSGPEVAARLRSERNQGRGQDMGWVSHERLGFNYRLTDLQAAIGIAQLERADRLLAARTRVATLYRERLGALGAALAGEGDAEGLVLPCPTAGRSAAAGSCTRSCCPREPTAIR
jgi:dTDP-4-amino-4,6-dideoxygalactose transaminase